MWNISSTFLSVLLTLIGVTGLTAAGYYDEHSRTRYERSAATFKCTEEGYHPDPRDCRIYYRCVDWGNGGPLTTFSFTCGVGTVFSKDKGDICTHPGDSGRSECDGSTDNELDSDLRDPSESPVAVVAPSTTVTAATRPQAITTWPSAGATEGATTAFQKPATTQSSPTTTNPPTAGETDNDVGCRNDGGPECTQEGFLADGCDCGRFHRCVDEGGHGGFRRYSFKCGEGTIWDPEIQACNHDWAVARRNCERGSAESAGGGGDNSGSSDGGQSNGDTDGSSPSEGQAGGDSNSPRPDSAGYPGMPDGPASSGYPASPGAQGLPDSSGYPGQPTSTAPTYPATVDSAAGASSSTESPITTGLAETSGYPTSSRRPDSVTGASVRPDSPHSPDTNKPWTGTCTEEGFFGDPKDCRKFYRCVGDGASFAKYEFQCGVGTAWDSSIQSCNHDRVVPNCGDRRPSNGTVSEPDGANADKPTSQAAPVNCTVASSLAPDVAQPTTTTGGSDRSTTSVSYLPPASSASSTVPSTVSYPSSATHTTTPATSYSPPSSTAATSVQRPESTTAGSVSPGGDTSATTATTTSSSIASPSQDGKGECTEAGFFPDREDCRKFYRCVEDGQSGYRKFEFQCGPGTAWDQSIQTCNHIDLVSCATDSNEVEQGSTKPAPPSQAPTTETTASSSSTSPPASPSSTESVTAPGTPNETTASEADKTEATTATTTTADTATVGGTEKPTSEKPTTSSAEASSTESSSEQSTVESSEASSSSTSETSSSESTESHGPDCTTRKPDSGAIKCDREGFHPHPTRCDKFYRCVDNGNGYNVYHFDCPPGTIFDPSISVCNYPESVYPPRDCTTGDATTSSAPASESTSTTTESTTRATTTEAEQTEGTTSASAEPTATTPSMETTTSKETSKMPDSGESTTESTVTEAPATDSSETTQTTSAAESSTEPAATESQEPSTTESQEQSTTESQEGSTTESQEQSTTESQEGSTTESQEQSTTESQEGSTTESQEQSTTTSEPTSKPTEPCSIGNLTDDQIVLVCPTGFRRHPKHCNLFYQCTTEGTMEIKLLVLSCPDDTIFDEDKIQCLPEAKSGQACQGTKANARFYRRLEDSASTSVVKVSTDRLCPEEGHFPYRQDCSDIFYKCKRDIRDRLQGYLYKCPENFVYWSVSRRCERATRLPMCSRAVHRDNTSRYDRWRIPTERLNLSARMLLLS